VEEQHRQQVESQLQQERVALEEARATLQREEAQGHLQRERTMLGEVRATLQLQDSEVTQLTRELVQEAVSFKELRNASKEKDTTILKLQQTAETALVALETEKKQVEGKLPLSILHLSLGFIDIRSQLICLLFLGLRAAIGTSTTQAEALQVAYNSSQQELEVL
jgi:hypothetical protein